MPGLGAMIKHGPSEKNANGECLLLLCCKQPGHNQHCIQTQTVSPTHLVSSCPGE